MTTADAFRVRQEPSKTTQALVWVAASAVLFSLGGLFVRSLHAPDAWTTVFYRSLSASVAIGCYLARSTKGQVVRSVRSLGLPGLVVTLALSGSSIGMVLALTKTSVAVVLVLFALAPLVTALVARLLIGEDIQPITWAAIAATIVGVGVMVWGPGTTATLVGVLLSLIAPISFAFGTVVIRRNPHITMVPAMFGACLINVVVASIFANPLSVSRHDLVVLVLFGLQLGAGLAIYASAASHAPAAQTALVSMLEPVLGPFWVWWFKNEYPGVAGFVGGGIVFSALAIHTFLTARQQTRLTS